MSPSHPSDALSRPVQLLLNFGHALDHMFLLIFATAVTAIAQDFGIAHWEDLMPYSVLAFVMFGLGSLPAGRLGDAWGRRPMMLVFFIGIGLASMATALAQGPVQLAIGLASIGLFASIYHPVGIPMLLRHATKPGQVIGVNGLAGNLGLALASVLTGLLVKHIGWRAAFVVPGLISIAAGVLFARLAPAEGEAPAKRKAAAAVDTGGMPLARLLALMTIASTVGMLSFNFSTNGNYEMLAERMQGITADPARLGLLMASVYGVAALAQLVVGRLLDRYPLKPLYLGVIAGQAVLVALSTQVSGYAFLLLQLGFMAFIFGAVPFTDAMIVRFVDDRLRSRVAGMRLAVSLGASSVAVWALGPLVKQAGFTTMLWVMVGCALLTMAVISRLPGTPAPSRPVTPKPLGAGAA